MFLERPDEWRVYHFGFIFGARSIPLRLLTKLNLEKCVFRLLSSAFLARGHSREHPSFFAQAFAN
jgi:hypothetical protein